MTDLSAANAPVEIVERKGLGHPDTICDALAEALSLTLCRYYRDQFGLILHHNVDKALLWGGTAQAAFRGGKVLAPMEIFLVGRATREFKGRQIPIEELAIETSREWLKHHLHALDVEHHVKLHTMIRPGSRELVELYLRQKESGIALANDTSCGVGYAPLDELEQMVLVVEHHLNSAAVKKSHPEIGEDIKVMGVREADSIALTIGCALIDRYITDVDDYLKKKMHVAEMVKELVSRYSPGPVSIAVNAADGITADSLFLTVTGTSAESGDDGEVGRGNRVNGLITPYRPMNMEAAAGKNPVTHVGKLYNLIAQRAAATIVDQIPQAQEAQCYLVSRIGHPVTEPQVVDVRVRLEDARQLPDIEASAKQIIHDQLQQAGRIQDEIIGGQIKIY